MIDLSTYDYILVNSSAGKDSQAMLDYVCRLADRQGVKNRVVVVHADLGKVEWKGTRELAEQQAEAYGVNFFVTKYSGAKGETLLDYIEERGKFPDSKARFCTSDFKRGPVRKIMTMLVKELNLGRQVRILNCLGLRAEESPARAKKVEFEHDAKSSNGKRHVDTWLPILSWSTAQVWDTIKASGVPHHPAYDLGMPRLSCCFCIFAPKDALVIAGQSNPELLDDYVRVEQKIGHTFRKDMPIASIKTLIEEGYVPKVVPSWAM